MTRPVLARALAVVASLLLSAWFALGAVQARDVDQADALITGAHAPTAAQARQARSLLDTASTLNPDVQVQLLRSQLAFERGNRPLAVRLADAATRNEPQNAQAWIQLISVSTGPKVPGEVRQVSKLVPTVPAAP